MRSWGRQLPFWSPQHGILDGKEVRCCKYRPFPLVSTPDSPLDMQPFLTIVLNNGGWKSPKLSLLGVHPTGLGSQATSGDLNVSFGPDAMNPDYGGIAAAAGGAWSKKLMRESELEEAMKEAIRVVMIERRCAVLDCWLERF